MAPYVLFLFWECFGPGYKPNCMYFYTVALSVVRMTFLLCSERGMSSPRWEKRVLGTVSKMGLLEVFSVAPLA